LRRPLIAEKWWIKCLLSGDKDTLKVLLPETMAAIQITVGLDVAVW